MKIKLIALAVLQNMKFNWIIALTLSFFLTKPAFSQSKFNPAEVDPEYTKVLIKRVAHFLDDLKLDDSIKYERVRDLVVRQYQGINWQEEETTKQVAALRAQPELEKTLMNTKIDVVKSQSEVEIFRLHSHFIAQLQTELTPEQVDMVKDGMTYGVLKRTYTGYINLLPQLTEAQKRYLMANLLEARELAMDKGSSDEKHATFGKYKGRINNYLSQQGIDMKKAELELKEKTEQEKKNKKN